MSNSVRSMLLKKVGRSRQSEKDIYLDKIAPYLSHKLNEATGTFSFALPLRSKDHNVENIVENVSKNDFNDLVDTITIEKNAISFNLFRDKYIKEIIESNALRVASPLLGENNKTVIVEFSSPNIAKPFHLGHLRSTIIGNYVANINSFLRQKVKKINYLGDWGTQLGLVQIGLKMININDQEMEKNAISSMYNAYVTANKLAETDSSIRDEARKIFTELEKGNSTVCQEWEKLKTYTVNELTRTYKRIGIEFDEYHWESMYNASYTKSIIALMEDLQLLTIDKEDRKIINLNSEKNVPVIKSDGSTLYITRDIAAAIDRFEKHDFDLMYYVVDNSQIHHFSSLVQILEKMKLSWVKRLKHINFGRISGMSTRKGTSVFLDDILNQMRDTMREYQMQTHTTKVSLDANDNSADLLAISAIVTNDLKRRRQKDYILDLNSIFDVKGDSGIKLQYTHCRLCSLESNSGASLLTECDPSLLKESEVDQLIMLISKFDEVVLKSYQDLQPCILTAYLFLLCNCINKAMATLKIKGEPSDLGNQRLLLFHASKNVLAEGMKLLGLIPLNKM